MLTDAELLLGAWRHLSTYRMNPSVAQLDAVAFSGRVYEMAWRLRGSGVSTVTRVHAIAIEAAISPRELERDLLPTLEELGWIEVGRAPDGTTVTVTETVPPAPQLVGLASQVLDLAIPSGTARAALELLKATTRQPLEREAALGIAQETTLCSDEEAEDALRALVAVGLVQDAEADDGRHGLFNPHVWSDSYEAVQAALRAEDARVRVEIGALIEEVSSHQGMPESNVQSTDQRWIDFAVAQGLIERSVVQTDNNVEKRFLFTPHLLKDPFGGVSRDPSGHARQLVGSMMYAATFARYNLRSPAAFVRALLRNGEAGDASPIGTDYPMLETAGIVRVVPGSSSDRYRLRLLQADVAEQALEVLELRDRDRGVDPMSRAGIRGQKSYVHFEAERARLARTAADDEQHRRRLYSALRETIGRRSF